MPGKRTVPYGAIILPAAAVMLFGCLRTVEGEIGDPAAMNPWVFAGALLVACTIIGALSTLAGVGGGVIFTPLMLGFTPLDSYIVRTTGLFVAMAGALIAARPYLRKGLANFRLLMLAAVPTALFAVAGALLAAYMKETAGETGEAVIRLVLGVLVLGIGVVFIAAGGRTEYPEVGEVDAFTARLGLGMTYREESLGRPVAYEVKRAGTGLALFCGVGLVSGMFGLGAGWAIVPVFNLVMLAPLKVAASCSSAMIGIGSTAAVWPYLMGGGMFPLVAIPCLLGMVIGAAIGSKIMLRAKPKSIRWVIIGVVLVAGVRLVIRALGML
ncbi:MAG: sulfite exporter TauE/SafE family protein [Planctomycetes bacterium]|nr:sulfite exporter TauE/SafE family protein [Planctomycetota bacterium]